MGAAAAGQPSAASDDDNESSNAPADTPEAGTDDDESDAPDDGGGQGQGAPGDDGRDEENGPDGDGQDQDGGPDAPASHDPSGTGEIMDAGARGGGGDAGEGESPLDVTAEEQAWDEARRGSRPAVPRITHSENAMLDAHPAPDATARPQLPPVSVPASGAARTAGDGPAALLDAARTLLPVLEAGRSLDAPTLRDAMTRAFGASDSDGAWVWKDAYEAAEAGVVLFVQRYVRAMRQRAGAGADGPRTMLAMLAAVAALEPSHTKCSEDQVRLQQFSTPLPLAYAALRAAVVRPGDTVLEPSAGTGMLAVMAKCALGKGVAGHLHLNVNRLSILTPDRRAKLTPPERHGGSCPDSQ